MTVSSAAFPAGYGSRADAMHWPALAAILFAAAFLRLLFENGPLGSDDVVYLSRAAEIARGEWTSADYNGALRYGFNLPAGLLMALFGVSELAANLWPFFCSLAEVAVVYVFALKAWGRGPAALAAGLLAVTPLHIASATRIHADPVVALFLSLAFLLVFLGERSGRPMTYFAAGLSVGMVFWVKELAIVTLFALLLYPLAWRRLPRGWLFFIAGGLVMLVAHLALMAVIAGDPLHLMKTVLGQVSRSFLGAMQGEDAPSYYFRYLFFDLRHTWLLGLLAAAGVALWLRDPSRRAGGPLPHAPSFAVFWLLAVIAILSFVPVSLSPLRFVMKQSNYLTLFLAPLALVSAYALLRMDRRLAAGAVGLVAIGGIALGALQQQAYRVFTSNSHAIVAFLRANPDAHVFGSTNNGNIVLFESLANGEPGLRDRFTYLTAVDATGLAARVASIREPSLFVVLDAETIGWGVRRAQITAPLPCWAARGTLTPAGFGQGRRLVDLALRMADLLPSSLATRIRSPLAALHAPRPATMFALDRGDPDCRASPAS